MVFHIALHIDNIVYFQYMQADAFSRYFGLNCFCRAVDFCKDYGMSINLFTLFTSIVAAEKNVPLQQATQSILVSDHFSRFWCSQ